jgi:hypothetical protein
MRICCVREQNFKSLGEWDISVTVAQLSSQMEQQWVWCPLSHLANCSQMFQWSNPKNSQTISSSR